MENNKKPVIINDARSAFYRENLYAQEVLLKALTDGVTDPEELRNLAGLKTVTDVYRTLDKIALRREYHEALAKRGMSFDKIAAKIQELMESPSQKIQLGTLNLLMKSLGLDKYEKTEETGKTWEEEIVKAAEAAQARGETLNTIDAEIADYEVVVPDTPQSELERQENERRIGREIYGD